MYQSYFRFILFVLVLSLTLVPFIPNKAFADRPNLYEQQRDASRQRNPSSWRDNGGTNFYYSPGVSNNRQGYYYNTQPSYNNDNNYYYSNPQPGEYGNFYFGQ